MLNFIKSLFVMGMVLVTSQSYALTPTDAVGPSSGELKFNGTIQPSCNLQNFVDGTIVANLDQSQVSSLNSGGVPATVKVRANTNGFTLPLGAAIIIGPDGQMTDVNISASAVAAGALLDGTPVGEFGPDAATNTFLFDAGIYDISVNATATRLDGAFKAGTYQLKIPVGCVIGA